MRSVCLGAIITFSSSALHAEPGECYASTFKLRDYSAATETWGEATSFMKIAKIDTNKIQFELLQYGGNFHTCALPGFAIRQPDGSFIFKDEKIIGLSLAGSYMEPLAIPAFARLALNSPSKM